MRRVLAMMLSAGWLAGCLGLEVDPGGDSAGLLPGENDATLADRNGGVDPVFILFVIDGSASMLVTDPPPAPGERPGRLRAVAEIVNAYLDEPSVSFGLIRFDSEAHPHTGRDADGDGVADLIFTRNVARLHEAIAALETTGTNTSYANALGLTEHVLNHEMEALAPAARSLSTCHVVFLTDGLPYPQDDESGWNTPGSIRRQVAHIAGLEEGFGLAGLRMHFGYVVGNAPGYVRDQARSFLGSLSEAGGGIYLEFETGRDIDFSGIDFLPGLTPCFPCAP